MTKTSYGRILFYLCLITLVVFGYPLVSHLGYNPEVDRRARTQADLAVINVAWKAYYKIYHRYPAYTNMSAQATRLLNGGNVGGGNAHGALFMEFDPRDLTGAGCIDSWGMTYQLAFDHDNDGFLETPYGRLQERSVVWSYGEDGRLSRDDLGSFWINKRELDRSDREKGPQGVVAVVMTWLLPVLTILFFLLWLFKKDPAPA